ALLVGTGVFGWILPARGRSWNPYPDPYVCIGSVVAMAAQGRAVVDCWFVWLAGDLGGVPLAVAGGLVLCGAGDLGCRGLGLVGGIDWSQRSKQTISAPHRSATEIGRGPDD